MIKRVGVSFLLLSVLMVTAVPTIWAKPATAVSLIYFLATEASDGVHLTWESGTEVDTVAYFIRRSEGEDYIDLTELYDANGQAYPGGLIDSEGGPSIGFEYLAIDRTAVTNTTYIYQLMEVESNNSTNLLETVIMTTGATPTPTSITIGSNPTTVSGQATATDTAVPTMTPTRASTASTTTLTNTPTTGASAPARVTVVSPTTEGNTAAENNPTNNNNSVASTSLQNSASGTSNQSDNQFAQTEPTPNDAYPANQPTLTPTSVDESYPAQPALPEASTPTAYPADFARPEEPTPTIIGVIGDSAAEIAGNETTSDSSAEQPSTNVRGLSVLWGGFILAGIIFVSAIIGSVLIFVRKRD